MKNLLLCIVLTFFAACDNKKDEYTRPENALDAGRGFIDNSLKGRFTIAKKYMIADQENVYWLDKVTNDYNRMSEQDKTGFSKASITINEIADLMDSITVINYSNSYKKVAQKVKVIRRNGEWLVDFKYTFSGNL